MHTSPLATPRGTSHCEAWKLRVCKRVLNQRSSCFTRLRETHIHGHGHVYLCVCVCLYIRRVYKVKNSWGAGPGACDLKMLEERSKRDIIPATWFSPFLCIHTFNTWEISLYRNQYKKCSNVPRALKSWVHFFPIQIALTKKMTNTGLSMSFSFLIPESHSRILTEISNEPPIGSFILGFLLSGSRRWIRRLKTVEIFNAEFFLSNDFDEGANFFDIQNSVAFANEIRWVKIYSVNFMDIEKCMRRRALILVVVRKTLSLYSELNKRNWRVFSHLKPASMRLGIFI